jgi:hypothetical protein
MNHHITIPAPHRLTARAAELITRWQRRLSSHLHTGDTLARHARWTITRTRFGGRTYHDPRFGQPTAAPAPRPTPPTDPAASTRPPARTAHPPTTAGPARPMAPERKSR